MGPHLWGGSSCAPRGCSLGQVRVEVSEMPVGPVPGALPSVGRRPHPGAGSQPAGTCFLTHYPLSSCVLGSFREGLELSVPRACTEPATAGVSAEGAVSEPEGLTAGGLQPGAA